MVQLPDFPVCPRRGVRGSDVRSGVRSRNRRTQCRLSRTHWRLARLAALPRGYFKHTPTSENRHNLSVLWACFRAPGAVYVLIAQLLAADAEGGASGEDAMDFYGLALVSFWMSVVLLLDR